MCQCFPHAAQQGSHLTPLARPQTWRVFHAWCVPSCVSLHTPASGAGEAKRWAAYQKPPQKERGNRTAGHTGQPDTAPRTVATDVSARAGTGHTGHCSENGRSTVCRPAPEPDIPDTAPENGRSTVCRPAPEPDIPDTAPRTVALRCIGSCRTKR